MYTLFGFSTQNTMKTLFVLEELGVKYDLKFVNLAKGEQRAPEYLKLNPVGKTPTLKHGDFSLFESGAICRYVANVENSPLYPADKMKRAKVDQWMDFFSCHLGRWLSALYFEKLIKPHMGLGNADESKVAEAEKFAQMHLPLVDQWLGENTYFLGDELTIADLFAFAYIDQTKDFNYDLSKYKNILSWQEALNNRDSIQKAKQKVKQ